MKQLILQIEILYPFLYKILIFFDRINVSINDINTA